MWSHLRFTVLRARYRAERRSRLPAYKGATFRGALGYALRARACVNPAGLCSGCVAPDRCAYGALFEAAADAAGLDGAFDLPMPYVLVPPLDAHEEYQPGDELELSLVLVGSARRWQPLVVEALARIGEQGLGFERGRWPLVRIDGETRTGAWREIALGSDDGGGPLAKLDWDALGSRRPYREAVTLRFLTPAHLTDHGRRVDHLDGPILVRRLLRRLGGLAENYCGWPPTGFDFDSVLAAAGRLTCRNPRLRPHSWDRYSTRRGQKHALNGLVGTVDLAAVDPSLWPLFVLGERLNIGKGASFGMGRYSLE